MVLAKASRNVVLPMLVIVGAAFSVFHFSSCGGGGAGGYGGGGGGGGDAATTTTTMTATPSAPTVTSPSIPHYSNGNSVTISGGCTTGATVTISGASITTQTYVCASSTYAFTVNKTSDATYSMSLKQTVDSVDSSATSFSWVRDTSAPSAPTVTGPGASPYTSSGSSINIVGACEDAATVSISGATITTQTYTCASSAYAFTIGKTSNATYDFSISQTDRAGNPSSSTTFQWVRDNTVPADVAITSPSLTAGVYYSNGNTLAITISCTSGLTVTLSGATITTQTGSCSSSAFTFSAITKTSDGSYVFSVKQTSAASIDSNAATMTWTRDTVTPSAPTATSPGASPYTSSGASITISGGCETNATVSVTGVTSPPSAVTCSSSAYTFSAYNPGSNGVYTFAITQTDRAGNTSGTTNYQWRRDTVAPAYSSINPVNSAGTLTSPAAVTVSGTGFLSSGTDTGTVITIGGSTCTRTATAVSDTAIECTPARHLAGAVNVVITKATGLSATGSGAYTYTYTGTATYSSLKTNIFTVYCTSCHGGASPQSGLDLASYSSTIARTTAFDAANSLLYQKVNTNQMPPGGPALSTADKTAIADWINQGINP